MRAPQDQAITETAAVEALINAMAQVRRDRHDDFRSHRHERFELEGDEPPFEHHVTVGVEKPPERTCEREGIQTVTHRIVLNLGDEIADRALLRRTFTDEFKRSPQRLALRGNESNALKFEPFFRQTVLFRPVRLIVDARERLQRYFV